MIRLLGAGAAEPAVAVPAAAVAPAAPTTWALPISYGVAIGGFAAGIALSLALNPGAFTPLDGFGLNRGDGRPIAFDDVEIVNV